MSSSFPVVAAIVHPLPAALMSDERNALLAMSPPSRGVSGTVPSWGAAAVRSTVPSILHPTILQHTLPFLTPTQICAVSRVCSMFACMTRLDAVWERVLDRDWSPDGEEMAELKRRVLKEAHNRRGIGDHTRVPIHKNVPVLSAAALEGSPPVPQSPEQQPVEARVSFLHVTPQLGPQKQRNESGIPRARSIAALNTLIPNASGTNSGNSSVGRSGLAMSPRPPHREISSPSSVMSKLSPESDGSESTSPSKRALTDSALAAPFSFPAGAALAAAFSPRPTPRSEILAVQRWLAPPDSFKTIYSDVVHSSYKRFQVAHHLEHAKQLPRIVQLIIFAASIVALLTWLAIQTQPFLTETDESLLMRPKFLAFLCTASLSLIIFVLTANMCRVVLQSLEAKRKLWAPAPALPPNATEADLSAAASFAAFQQADQAWWRHHSTNRGWYFVRYQVWDNPQLSWILLLLANLGSFITLWMLTTIVFGTLWPAAGVALGMLWPGVSVLFSFQLGRMVRVSRTMHQLIVVMASALQLCCLILFVHGSNPCLLWVLNYSLLAAFGALLASGAPNMLLLFFIFWLSEDYLLYGWTPVILPPQDLPSQHQLSDEESQHRGPTALERVMSPTANSLQARVRPIGFAAGASGAASGDATSQTDSSAWAAMHIPPARTLGRIILGSEFERNVFEARVSSFWRAQLLSRVGVSLGAGSIIYLASHAYWSHLFLLFLSPHAHFATLPLGIRLFHLYELGQYLSVSCCVSVLAVVVTLQNRDWRWWWTAVHVNVTALAAVSAHYTIWLFEQTVVTSESRRFGTGSQPPPSVHWLHGWPAWICMLCVAIGISLVANLIAIWLLYAPKSVRAMMLQAAQEAEAEARVAEAQRVMHEFHARQRKMSRGEDKEETTHTRHHHESHSHHASRAPCPSASPAAASSLASYALPSQLFPTHSSLSFAQSLMQPPSPAVELTDPAFDSQLAEIQAHAAAANAGGRVQLLYPLTQS